MTEQHIDNEALSLFTKVSSNSNSAAMDDTQYNAVLDHLAICQECREQAAMITTLQNNFLSLQQTSQLSDEANQLICDYIDGHLDAEQAERVKAMIESQADAMKAALHYQSHIESMPSAVVDQAEHRVKENRSTEGNYPAGISDNHYLNKVMTSIREFFSYRMTVGYTMAATTMVFIAVLSLLPFSFINENHIVIATYQDNPIIRFTEKDKLPGMGFFAQSSAVSKPFENAKVELLSDDRVKISWPAIDGVELYKMRLQSFYQGKKSALKEHSSNVNHVFFELDDKEIKSQNRRYEWTLYGNTIENRMFYASGGFVINNVK